jgi:CubicO group peptidase (beta-lactamase class C family)
VPGAVIAQVSEAGVQKLETFGVSNLASQEPVRANTAFHLYSGTKLFTACGIMRLVERDLLDLNADIRELLPECEFRHALTVRQLASHSSGLSDTLRAFVAIHFPGEARPTTAEALARYHLKGGRPSGKAKYRNVNYAILGELVARLAGESYEDFVRASLLDPWNSGADFTASADGRPATGYARRFSLMRLLARPLLGAHGARVFDQPMGGYVSLLPFDLDTTAIGGLFGSAADFAPMVAEFLSAEDAVLRADTRSQMLTQCSKGAAGIASKLGVGIGWKLGEVDGTRFWNHEGGGPGFCTELRIYPEQGVGFVMLMNLSHSRRLSWCCHEVSELLRKAPSGGQ